MPELGSIRSVMPPPGAVCPALVMKGLVTLIRLFSEIVPPVLKTTYRGPVRSTHDRRVPGPESAREVTAQTAPSRPPGVSVPKPSAPGKALVDAATGDVSTWGPTAVAVTAAAATASTGREYLFRNMHRAITNR